ncbi:hypothetical protein D3C73_1388310 [compost metagenome]
MDFSRGEDRRRAHSASGQQCRSEEAIAAVVALADQHRDARTRKLSPLFDLTSHRMGQPVSRPLHKNSALTGGQERLFRIPDLLSGEGADHCL